MLPQFTPAFGDDEFCFTETPVPRTSLHNTSLPGGDDALGPIGSDATLESPDLDVPPIENFASGLRAKKHTKKDNEDILYCYLWAREKARQCYGGYSKYMCVMWEELRPEKPLSKTALATKGKRLHDRALKDLSANGWLGLDDLEKIQRRVEADFGVDSSGVCEIPIHDGDSPLNESDGVGGSCGSSDDGPRSERPVSEEYKNLLLRAMNIFHEIKGVPIEQQMRKRLKKKNLSSKMLNEMEWLAYDLMSTVGPGENDDLFMINTIIYTVAAVLVFKEGQEFSAGESGANVSGRVIREPMWKSRITRKILVLRKEADILKASLDNKLRQGEAPAYFNSVMKKYCEDGF